MPKRFRDYDLDTPYLLPPSLDDWVPEDHLARFMREVVGSLDLSKFYRRYPPGRGQPPYHPAMMLSLLLYAYSTGVFSSRKIERATYENVAFRFLAANQHPDHDSVATFRRTHLEDLNEVFMQVLNLCREMGLVSLGLIAIDGTKIKANASKRKTLEQKELEQLVAEQQAKVADLLTAAEEADKSDEPERHRLSGELAKQERRLEVLESAKRRLDQRLTEMQSAHSEARAKQADEAQAVCDSILQERKAAGKSLEDARRSRGLSHSEVSRATGIGRGRLYAFESGTRQPSEIERERLQALLDCELVVCPRRHLPRVLDPGLPLKTPPLRENTTDGDSRLIKPRAGATAEQLYNPQSAVDSACQIITAYGVSNSASDKHNLLPLLEAVKKNLGTLPENVAADSGYCSLENLLHPLTNEVNLLIPPTKQQFKDPYFVKMKEKLEDPTQRELYQKRASTIEPVFGNIKQNRGFRQFTLRGHAKVLGEWCLLCITHNLGKLFRFSG